MQLLTSSPCTKRRHISRARGGSNIHPSPAQPLVAARSSGGFTGRAKARPARCAEAEPGEVCWCCQGDSQRQSCSQGRCFARQPGSGSFSAVNLHWFLSDLQNILDVSHMGLSLPDTESRLGKWPEHTCSDATDCWGRGESLGHPE